MFNGVPQSAGTLIPDLQARSVSTFRVDGLFEDAETLRMKVQAYAEVLCEGVPITSAMAKLGMSDRYGVTNGQLYNIRGYQDRKKEFAALATLGDVADPGLKAILPAETKRTPPLTADSTSQSKCYPTTETPTE
jgi:hypothetical protein